MLMRHVTQKTIPHCLFCALIGYYQTEPCWLLSLFIAREGGGSGAFFWERGVTWILGEQNGESFVNHRKNLEEFNAWTILVWKHVKLMRPFYWEKKCLQSQLVLSFTRADVPPVASPYIVVWDCPLAFLLSSCCRWWFFLGWRKRRGESRNLSRVMRRITSIKHHLKGGVQKFIQTAPLQAINNDWSLTGTFPRSMINKSLPNARAHQAALSLGLPTK